MTDTQRATTVQGMAIARPPGWRDSSMLILNAEQPGKSGVTPNLVVTREVADDLPNDPPERLETFVDRQLDQMRAALVDLTEVARRHATAARPFAELKIDWTSDGIPLTQWITFADADESTLTIATATAGRGDFAEMEPAFRSMLQSFRLT